MDANEIDRLNEYYEFVFRAHDETEFDASIRARGKLFFACKRRFNYLIVAVTDNGARRKRMRRRERAIYLSYSH